MYPAKQRQYFKFSGALWIQRTLATLSSGMLSPFKWFENVGAHLPVCISSIFNLQQDLMKNKHLVKYWFVGVAGPLQDLPIDNVTLNFNFVQGAICSHVCWACWHKVCPSCREASQRWVSIQPSLMFCPFIPVRGTVYAGASAEIHQLSCEQWTTFFPFFEHWSQILKKK